MQSRIRLFSFLTVIGLSLTPVHLRMRGLKTLR